MLYFTKAKRYTAAVMAMLTAVILNSCTAIMDDDLPECKAIVNVCLKYDYNLERGDLFHDQVGWVRVFVVDADTKAVVRDTVVSNRDNADIIRQDRNRYYKITFTDLPLGRKYSFVAMSLQRPYDETMAHKEDKFIANFPQKGESIKDFKVHLSHATTPNPDETYSVTAPACGLDTLWISFDPKLSDQDNYIDSCYVELPKTIQAHYSVTDTVCMMRDTKYLNIALHNVDEDKAAQMRHEDYRIEIVDNNCSLAWNNNVISHNKLLYTPHAQWTTENISSEGIVERTAARYEISFSRLMLYTNPAKGQNAIMQIIRNSDNMVIASIDLPQTLAAGRNYYSWIKYKGERGLQEYLDRKHQYDLDFFLKGDTWLYMNIKINITPWVIRKQHIVL